jgi:large subunit ribosomal protein L18
MKASCDARRSGRERRKKRVRQVVSGGGDRPRLSVFRSLKHIYAQLIDDERGVTLVHTSTLSEAVRSELGNGNHSKTDASKAVGKVLARMALEKGIKQVRFDRGGYLYHGRVAALAQAAREGGLEF